MGLRAAILAIALIAPSLAACEDRAVRIARRGEAVAARDIETGAGKPVERGDTVTATYVLRSEDGETIVDITGKDGGHTWTVGDGTVIVGLDRTVLGMRPGGVRTAELPPELHYGRAGYADRVPPSATLTIEVHLAAIH